MVSSGLAIEPTNDAKLIKSLCAHPKIWPMVCDDFTPSVEDWEPPMCALWLLASDDEGILGLFCLTQENTICWQVHVMMLPFAWGQMTTEATKNMFEWVWKHTECKRLVGSIPADNPLTIGLALRTGMEQFGINHKSFQRKGKLHDQVLFGISRPEAV